MSTNRSLTVDLPAELAHLVDAKVASGEYGSEGDVVREGLRALLDRDTAAEAWLRRDVATAYDAQKADPTRAIPAETVVARLEACFARTGA